MNATFQTIDPGTQEVLATVCEMGKEDVDRAVTAAYKAFHGTNGKNGWKDTPVEKRCETIAKLIELTERDRDGRHVPLQLVAASLLSHVHQRQLLGHAADRREAHRDAVRR